MLISFFCILACGGLSERAEGGVGGVVCLGVFIRRGGGGYGFEYREVVFEFFGVFGEEEEVVGII